MDRVNTFIFSKKYRLLRHLIFWAVHIPIFSFLFRGPGQPYTTMHILSALWVPAFIIYSYPIMYWAIPKLLLKEKYVAFCVFLILWAVFGYFFNYLFRSYILFPVAQMLNNDSVSKNPWAAASYLSMNVMAGFGSMIVLFKYWVRKQRDFLSAEKEKAEAELELLKAQIHPHFLFNTLNNIYSFALDKSPATPSMILQLSSLLNYVLYEGKFAEVLLQREIEMMQDYINLERERYANKLEISLNIEGDTFHYYIAPLLLLPFLENAFKHGISELLEKPWLSVDITINNGQMYCKIINSKNESLAPRENGIGITNVQKRLAYLYPGEHTLKISDEGSFFVVALVIKLHKGPTPVI